jgi:hypothetical protein
MQDELLDEVWQSISRAPLVLPVSVFYSLSHLSYLPGERQENETSFQKFEAKLADLNTRLRIVEGADFEITSISNCF